MRAIWKDYVGRLSANAWSLDDRARESLLASLEALSAAEDFSTQDVEAALRAAGVGESVAHLIAPSLRVAMLADRPRPPDSK